MTKLIEELATVVGEKHVITGAALAQRPTSFWDPSPTRALAVVRPASTAEVSAILKCCHAHRQAVVLQGGRTGCVRGGESAPDEIVLCTQRMDKIEQIDAQAGTAIVQAGALLENVQIAARNADWLFPLDLGARGTCTIGGNVSTNAGGINVLRYGMLRQQVLGLEAVLADGTIVSSMNSMLKNNAGYDLKQLFIGTEGTLGVVTKVVLRLFPRPKTRNTALIALTGFAQTAKLLGELQQNLAGGLSAFEVMWGDYYSRVTGPGGHRAPLGRDYPFYVIAEAEGGDVQTDDARFAKILETAIASDVIADGVVPKSEKERTEIWNIRENFESVLEGSACYLYDISLPIHAMSDYVDRVKRAVSAKWRESECYVIGHMGDGNLHLFVKPNDLGDHHAESDECVYAPLADYGGSVSAEHGIGLEKRQWLRQTLSKSELMLMATLKHALDPHGILNSGRVFTLECPRVPSDSAVSPVCGRSEGAVRG